MFCAAHQTQHERQLQYDQSSIANNSSTAGSRNHHHKRSLKWQKQTEKCFKIANRVLWFIARNFTYKNKEPNFPLYKSLVRAHLKQAVQFWSQHLRRDIDKTEKVQRTATKMIPKSEPASESRTFISSALYKKDCGDNYF